MAGVVESIFICPSAGAPPLALERVLVETAGLQGDRYCSGVGTFSGSNLTDGRGISIITAEALDGLPQFGQGLHRRNLVVRGVDLDALRGKRFHIGDVEFEGVRGCPPCGYLARLVGVDAKQLLHRKGGLRCDVLTAGTIHVDDAIELV